MLRPNTLRYLYNSSDCHCLINKLSMRIINISGTCPAVCLPPTGSRFQIAAELIKTPNVVHSTLPQCAIVNGVDRTVPNVYVFGFMFRLIRCILLHSHLEHTHTDTSRNMLAHSNITSYKYIQVVTAHTLIIEPATRACALRSTRSDCVSAVWVSRSSNRSASAACGMFRMFTS